MPVLRNPTARRRNVSTTVVLPAEGRLGRAREVIPAPPYELGEAGMAWWIWAWRTPQSFGWSVGDDYLLARRAAMEDPKTVLSRSGEAVEVEGGTPKEKLEIDDRLGLTPRGLAQLHWTIVASQEPASAPAPGPGAPEDSLEERRARRMAS